MHDGNNNKTITLNLSSMQIRRNKTASCTLSCGRQEEQEDSYFNAVRAPLSRLPRTIQCHTVVHPELNTPPIPLFVVSRHDLLWGNRLPLAHDNNILS